MLAVKADVYLDYIVVKKDLFSYQEIYLIMHCYEKLKV